MQTEILNYHTTLQSLINRGDSNEHSFRTAFENLLNSLKPNADIHIIHEPKAKQGQHSIRPDFKVYTQMQSYESLIGFIECKNFGADLSPLIKGKQIEKYLSVCHNIILTDYNRFVLLSYDKIEVDFTLFRDFQSTPTQAEFVKIQNNFSQLLQRFFGTAALIADRDELVKVLSSQSFYLSYTISNEAQNDLESQNFKAYFEKSYQAFRNLEHTDLSIEEFCDILAQSIVYGMFVAHIDSKSFEIDKIPTQSFAMLLPEHFAVLKEFIGFSLPLANLPESIKYALENIIKTITLIDKPTFQREIRNITTYLYEDFLKEYDNLRGTDNKKSGGVYYTPEPIVDIITHSINELLNLHFGKSFSDDCVKVLDFATGTGSFLEKVFEIILENKSEVFTKETIINKCFRDIYGFEISFVPYIVAHLKLSEILRAKGFSEFSANQKFQVYLTNTLDLDTQRQIQLQVPFDNLKNERDKSLKIKHKDDLLVILGNPPYNMRPQKNKDKEIILNLLQSYKPKTEKNIQPLNDDYIKFIRFAQWKLTEQNQKHGIMGFITNNSYLDGAIHYKMRESLAKTFDEIYILNLHGDSAEDKNDKNVFDIRVGVCISIFVKYERESSLRDSRIESAPSLRGSEATEAIHESKNDKLAQIHYFSTKDNEILRRADKFALLNKIANKGLKSIKWQKLKLDSPYFWFVPKSFKNNEYNKFWALAKLKSFYETNAIFKICNSGLSVRKDNLLIQVNKNKIKEVIYDMQNLSRESILQKYHFKETKDWTINEQRENFINPQEQDILGIAYRPFDTQFCFYPLDKISKIIPRGDSRKEIAKHFIDKENFGLMFQRGLNQGSVFMVDKMGEGNFLSARTYIAPLYCYDSNLNGNSKTPNFTQEFSAFIAKHKVLKSKSPEQILAFIYGNLYNPAYRAKYLAYLKIGFPRVDFEVGESKFEKYATLGQKLIDLHLMREIPNDKSIDLKFREGANKSDTNFTLDKPKYEPNLHKIILNADLEIVGVSAEVWDYTIGGYKVLDKWLKYRTGITLEQSDFTHILNVAKILKATLAIQAQLAEI